MMEFSGYSFPLEVLIGKGKWESAVRCVKLHLRRVTGNSTLTFEQMRTLLAQISAVINSRPLCYTCDNENNYLSPAHFLIGRPLTTVPDLDLSHIPVGLLGYWQSSRACFKDSGRNGIRSI